MQQAITIRPECAEDIAAIRGVHERAFPTSAEARLVDRLRVDEQLSVSLVALLEGDIVGHVALSPITIRDLTVGLGLAPVAVVPERQRCGIGGALVRHALAACAALVVPMVVVLGEPDYYARFGFVPAAQFGLDSIYNAGDAFQAILLAANPPPQSGLVHYAPAFAGLE